jgi:hypothetical protein
MRLMSRDTRSVPCRRLKVNYPSTNMALIRVTDEEVLRLIQEAKPLPQNLRAGMTLKNGHYRKTVEFSTPSGNEFVVNLRKTEDEEHFSVILQYRIPGTSKLFRLRRYNDNLHIHQNVLEGEKFCDFHIHTATARYQKAGHYEDQFAEITTRHFDFDSAVDRLIEDCGFDVKGMNYRLF